MADRLLPLGEAGANVFLCSQRCFWEPELPEIGGEPGLNLADFWQPTTVLIYLDMPWEQL